MLDLQRICLAVSRKGCLFHTFTCLRNRSACGGALCGSRGNHFDLGMVASGEKPRFVDILFIC